MINHKENVTKIKIILWVGKSFATELWGEVENFIKKSLGKISKWIKMNKNDFL